MAETHNPYAPPREAATKERDNVTREPRVAWQPAPRAARLLGAVVDIALECVAMYAAVRLGGLFGVKALLGPMGALGVLLLGLAPQAVLITTRGQSIGKMIFQIYIVWGNGRRTKAGFLRGFLLRTLVPWLVLWVVLASSKRGDICGSIVMLVVILQAALIFGSNRRCGHDYLAGTYVEKLAPAGFVSDKDRHKPKKKRPPPRTVDD